MSTKKNDGTKKSASKIDMKELQAAAKDLHATLEIDVAPPQEETALIEWIKEAGGFAEKNDPLQKETRKVIAKLEKIKAIPAKKEEPKEEKKQEEQKKAPLKEEPKQKKAPVEKEQEEEEQEEEQEQGESESDPDSVGFLLEQLLPLREVKGGKLTFTDGNALAWTNELCVEVLTDIKLDAELDAGTFLALLNKLPEKAKLEIIPNKEGHLKIKAGNITSTIVASLVSTCPWSKVKFGKSIACSEDFLAALKKVLPIAVKAGEGILSNVHANGNVLEACDNIVAIESTVTDKVPEMLIPASLAKLAIANDAGFFAIGESALCFGNETWRAMATIVKEDFPDVSGLFASMKETKIAFPAELLSALDRSSLFVGDGSAVELVIGKGKLGIKSVGSEGSISERFAVECDKDVSLSIDPRSLAFALGHATKAAIGKKLMRFTNEGTRVVVSFLAKEED